MPITVFGQGAVQTAYVSYIEFDIEPNSLTLIWPTSYVDVPFTDTSTGIHYNVLAASMQVTCADPNAHTITLPDATEGSVGNNFIISNVGAAPFNVLYQDGTAFLAVENGISYWVQLTDNSTANGTWEQITFGAGTSTADPIALAGPGLIPYPVDPTKLATNIPVQSKNVPYTVVATDRGSLIVWTGGGGQITLPAIGAVQAGFYVSFNNQGAGELNIVADGGVLIDGQANLAIEIQQSTMIISDGTVWWTLGFGQSQFDSIGALNKSLTPPGAGNITLTASEASFTIQQYTGILAGNVVVFFPPTTNYWYISNNTTGNFTVSVQLGTPLAPIGVATIIPQTHRAIFYSDGVTGLYIIPNNIPIGATFPDGTAAEPGIAFSADDSTGLYRGTVPGVSLGMSVGGVAQGAFDNTGLTIPAGKFITAANGTAANPSLRFTGAPTTGLYEAGNNLGFSYLGASKGQITATGLTMAPAATVVVSDATNVGITTLSSVLANSLLSFTNGAFTSSFKIATGGSTGTFTFQSGGTPLTTLTTDGDGCTISATNLIFTSALNLNGGGTNSTITLSVPGSPAIGTASFGIYNNFGLQIISTAQNGNTGTISISPAATSSFLNVISSTNVGNSTMSFQANDGGIGNIRNNSILSIVIGTTGIVTFPAQTAATLTALMPASVNGALAYYDGAAWVTLPPGANGQTLTIAGGIPTWA